MKTQPQHSSPVEDYSRPWAIIRLLPDARRYTVARFYNRRDAEDHRRFLNRFMPASEFAVLFDVPKEQLQHKTLANRIRVYKNQVCLRGLAKNQGI